MSERHIRLLAHNIRSLWNVGSLFRTCDAFAVEQLYLTGYTGYPPRKEISKTAIHAEQNVVWEHHVDPLPVMEQLKNDGWTIAALELTESAVLLKDYQPSGRTLLILGQELSGVPEELLTLSDVCLQIPMLGQKESLNVSVAAGVALHHLRWAF